MIVVADSCCLSGSKITRLLKHGIAGHVVETVDVSWIAKPCGVSSRWARFIVPPDLGALAGAWPMAGTPPKRSPDTARPAARNIIVRGRMLTYLRKILDVCEV